VRVDIEDYYDGFLITLINEEDIVVNHIHFNQEDSRASLVDVFNQLGIEATYSEVY
jgi:hypothetical protein